MTEIIIIYLIGALLSFGRINGFVNFWIENGLTNDRQDIWLCIIVSAMSWAGFMSGIIAYVLYLTDKEEFRIGLKPIRQRFFDYRIKLKI